MYKCLSVVHNAQQIPNIGDIDIVLCDVPCSGDGAIRKIPQTWKTFKLKHANTLHPLQCKILMKGLITLKIDG